MPLSDTQQSPSLINAQPPAISKEREKLRAEMFEQADKRYRDVDAVDHADKADKYMRVASTAFGRLPKAEDIGESKGLINSKADKSDEAKQKQVTYAVLHLIDWAQTRDLSRKISSRKPGDTWHEQNFVLGDAPHQDKVDAYFALTGLAKMYLDNNLPEKWKEPFQDLMIDIEKGAVGNNFNIGIKAKF